MDYKIIKADEKDKDKLYRLLQYALYDGSQYVDNHLNADCTFDYGWFDNYFTDKDRDAYFIKKDDEYIGMCMVNEYLQINNQGKCVSEFLILPKYRRNHIGKRVAYDIFEMYKGDWEVQPMENNPVAYTFWKNIINEYTSGNYKIRKNSKEDIFIFNNKE